VEFLSTAHLVVLALTALLCVLAVVVPRRWPERRWLAWPARGLAVLFVASEVALRVVLLAQGDWDWGTDLPLQLSDAALVAAVVALWSARPPALAVELTYLWAFTATVQALATPALHQGPDHLFFYVFFVTHSGVLVAACYLMWGQRLTLRPGAAWRAFAASAAVATAAGTANVITGGNYMFLRRVPSKGSLLDLMGPWPWYLVSAAGLALALFALLARLRRSDPAGAWRGLGGLTRSGRPGPAAAWALYDFANTVFSFAIVSFAMSLWAIRFLGEGAGTLAFTVAVSASVLLNAAVSPVLGALSDARGRRKPFLAAFTAVLVVATALIGVVPIELGLVLFGVANFAFQAALIYQDSLLRTVARPEARGRLSGMGAALGYAGALVAGLLFTLTTDADGQSTALSFVLVAALVAATAAPALVVVPEEERPPAAPRGLREVGLRPWRTTLAALRRARATPGLLRFVVARFLYQDPVSTAIAVMSAFAVTAVGLSPGQALNVLLVLIVVAAGASVGWGRLADRIGPKATLTAVLVLWAVGLSLLAGFLAPVPFLVAGAVLGAGVGGTAVLDRVMLVRLARPAELGQMLGVFSLAGKSSGVVGPLVYGALVAALLEPLGRGAFQVAVVVLTVPLVAGLVLVRGLPETPPRELRAPRAAEREALAGEALA
jgi:MFS transporter, UMF1 family